MDNEKNLNLEAAAGSKEGEFSGENASRARNRTVMLTPEITGQVRARLQQEMEPGHATPTPRPSSGFDPTHQSNPSGGFVPASSGRIMQEPRRDAPQTALPAPNTQGGIVWTKETPVVGFLVSFDSNPNGDFYVLRSGRVMVTSQASMGNNSLIINDDSVSPMHAIMRISPNGEIQVLDQLSEIGTKIKRFGATEEETLSGDKGTVEHGDVIKFGKRSFYVCIVPVTSGS